MKAPLKIVGDTNLNLNNLVSQYVILKLVSQYAIGTLTWYQCSEFSKNLIINCCLWPQNLFNLTDSSVRLSIYHEHIHILYIEYCSEFCILNLLNFCLWPWPLTLCTDLWQIIIRVWMLSWLCLMYDVRTAASFWSFCRRSKMIGSVCWLTISWLTVKVCTTVKNMCQLGSEENSLILLHHKTNSRSL